MRWSRTHHSSSDEVQLSHRLGGERLRRRSQSHRERGKRRLIGMTPGTPAAPRVPLSALADLQNGNREAA